MVYSDYLMRQHEEMCQMVGSIVFSSGLLNLAT